MEAARDCVVAPRMPRKLTPEEFADYLGVHRQTVYRWLHNGEIEGAAKFGRQWRIDPGATVTARA